MPTAGAPNALNGRNTQGGWANGQLPVAI